MYLGIGQLILDTSTVVGRWITQQRQHHESKDCVVLKLNEAVQTCYEAFELRVLLRTQLRLPILV